MRRKRRPELYSSGRWTTKHERLDRKGHTQTTLVTRDHVESTNDIESPHFSRAVEMVLRDTCPAYLPPSSPHISPLLISRQCGGALSTSRSATLSPNVRHDWHHWLSSLLSRRLRARASLASLLSLVGRLFGERTRVSKSRAFAWPSVSHVLVLSLSSASAVRETPLSA